MNRKKLLALGLAAVMAVSFAIPALASTASPSPSPTTTESASPSPSASATTTTATTNPSASATTTATAAPTATPKAMQAVSPAKVADIIDSLSVTAIDNISKTYDTLPDEDVKGEDYTVADIYAEGAETFEQTVYEVLDHLDLLSWVDTADDLTNYQLHGSGARLYDNYSEAGISTAFQNTDKSITASYVIGGTQRNLFNIGSDIPLTEDQKKSTFYNVPQMQIENAKMYAEYTWFRNTNRLSVDYGTKGSTSSYGGVDKTTADLGGVDVVYRGENSIFMQIFYPVQRSRENPEVETYFVARILLQKDGRVRVSSKNTTYSKITRLVSGYPSWNDFKLKDATSWDFNGEKFTLTDKEDVALFTLTDKNKQTATEAPAATDETTDTDTTETVDVNIDATVEA